MGYKILDADSIAKEVIEMNSVCVEELRNEFGVDIINNDNTINRRVLSEKAFSSKEELNKLNKITHPYITKQLENMILKMKLSGENVVVDAALLFESGINKMCDFNVAVLTPKKIRLLRIISRDKISREQAVKRINLQHKDRFYKANCDYVLDGSKKVLSIYDDVNKIVLRGIAKLDV